MRKGRTFFISFEKKKQYEADIFFRVLCVRVSFPFHFIFFRRAIIQPFQHLCDHCAFHLSVVANVLEDTAFFLSITCS